MDWLGNQVTARASLATNAIMDPRVFTDLDAGLKSRNLCRAEVTSWTGALGDEVQGILQCPGGYEPGKRYPLVFMIHGGPTVANAYHLLRLR